MITTVPGIYKEGKIELLATPAGVREGPVLVTLEEVTKAKPEPCILPFGQYREGRESGAIHDPGSFQWAMRQKGRRSGGALDSTAARRATNASAVSCRQCIPT